MCLSVLVSLTASAMLQAFTLKAIAILDLAKEL